jgi:uncharacterized protein (DUF2267 family)
MTSFRTPDELLGKEVFSGEGNLLGIVDKVADDKITVRDGARIPKKVEVPLDTIDRVTLNSIILSLTSTEFNRGIGAELEKMMPPTGEEVKERAQFYHEVRTDIGVDLDDAEGLVKVVFYMLSARLRDDQEEHLLAQLSPGIASLWMSVRQRGVIKFNRTEFLQKIKQDANLTNVNDALKATRAVIEALKRRINPGEIKDVGDALPLGLRGIWLGQDDTEAQ